MLHLQCERADGQVLATGQKRTKCSTKKGGASSLPQRSRTAGLQGGRTRSSCVLPLFFFQTPGKLSTCLGTSEGGANRSGCSVVQEAVWDWLSVCKSCARVFVDSLRLYTLHFKQSSLETGNGEERRQKLRHSEQGGGGRCVATQIFAAASAFQQGSPGGTRR